MKWELDWIAIGLWVMAGAAVAYILYILHLGLVLR